MSKMHRIFVWLLTLVVTVSSSAIPVSADENDRASDIAYQDHDQYLRDIAQIPITSTNKDVVSFGDSITYEGVEYVVDDANRRLYKIGEKR